MMKKPMVAGLTAVAVILVLAEFGDRMEQVARETVKSAEATPTTPKPAEPGAPAKPLECPDASEAILQVEWRVEETLTAQGIDRYEKPSVWARNAQRNGSFVGRTDEVCTYYARSYVEIENRFGGYDRMGFSATVETIGDDLWRVTKLEMVD